MLKRLSAFVTVVCVLFAGSICSAGELEERITIIHVKHRVQRYDIEKWDSAGRKVDLDIPLESRQKISLRPGERVKILIDDPNPFLYKYSLADGKETPTANGAAAQEFAASLLSLVNILDPPKKTSDIRQNQEPNGRSHYGQIRLASFRPADQPPSFTQISQVQSSAEVLHKAVQDLESVVLPSTEDPSQPPRAEDAATYARERMIIIRDAVQAVAENPVPNAGGGAVRRVLKDAGISDPGAFLQKFKEDVSRLYLFVSQVNSLIKQVDEGRALAAQAAVSSWSLDGLSKDIQASYIKLHAVNQELSSRLAAQQEIRRSQELQDAIALGLALQSTGDVDMGLVIEKEVDAKITDVKDQIEALEIIRLRLRPRLSGSVQNVNEFEEAGQKLDKFKALKLRLEGFKANLNTLKGLTEGLAKDPFYLSLGFILPYERDTTESLKQLQGFATSMTEVDKPVEVGIAQHSSLVTPKSVVVKAVDRMPEGVKPVRSLKEYAFEFQPYSTVQLGVGGAVVYSFVEKHSFSATRNSDGKLVITDTESGDYTGAKVAAMLTIVPSRWAESDFHPLFELGVRPDSNVGLYGGMGIRFSRLFSAGAGVAFEQVDELKAGLRPGDELTSADQLKTQKRFTSGLYLHFTFSMGVGGGR